MKTTMEMGTDCFPSPRTPLQRHHSDLTLTLSPTPSAPTSPLRYNHNSLVDALKPEERGIRLVQLLLACAAHTAASNLARADACLRLISVLSSHSGDSMQRLAAHLASSLASRLLRRRWPGVLSALHRCSTTPSDPKPRLIFARSLPYLPFAHAVTGRTLVRTLAQESLVHLVDLGATFASVDLWIPILRALSRTPRRLKLTCISPDLTVLESLASVLTKEAETLSVPFQFNPVNTSLRELNFDTLRVRPGEALAVVSVLSLHELLAEPQDSNPDELKPKRRRTVERIDGFLTDLRALSPKVMVVAEQESDHNSARVADRFAKALHYYSAVFDSVESATGAGLMTGEERAAVEEMLGREMRNVVACEGEERVERHEMVERWTERMAAAGFAQVRAWGEAGEEGRRVVEGWPAEGRYYGVVMYRNCFSICWHDRPLYAVSAWQS